MKPPANRFLKPKFGIGILIGAGLILASQMSGSDSAFGMALGGGVGIALGLTQFGGLRESRADRADGSGKERS